MSTLVLDSGGVTRLARQSQDTAALIAVFRRDEIWPPVVPSVVLVESLAGRSGTDALVNRFLKTCDIAEELSEHLARRAGLPRISGGCGGRGDGGTRWCGSGGRSWRPSGTGKSCRRRDRAPRVANTRTFRRSRGTADFAYLIDARGK